MSQYAQWNQGRSQTSLPRPANVFTDGTFSPLTPIIGPGVNTPNDENLTDPRRYEYQVGWNMPIGVPGSEGLKLASFQNLRAISDLYSVANACIDLRITEIRGLDWDIVPTPDAEKAMRSSPGLISDFQKRRAEALRFFKRPDSDYADFSSWFAAALYDVFQVDALSLYLWPTKMKGKGLLGSNLGELALIDGTSIRPLIDVYGQRPKPPFPAYQQYLYGVPRTDLMTPPDPDLIDDSELVAEYRSNQLLYLPYTTRRWTPYGFPPIERALIPAMAGLNRQQYQLDYFNEGTIPGMFVSPGDAGMTFDQQRTLQDALNALAGDPAWKHKIIVLPPGSRTDPQKPTELADQFDEIVMTQMCMAFGVMPMELGISPKVSTTQSPGAANQMAKASADVNQRKAMKPLLNFLKATIFDKILQEICGQADMEWHWEGTEQGIDEQAQVGILTDKISIGLMSIDEGRNALGLQSWGLPISSDPGMVTQNGFVPLGAIDPTTGAPIGNQPMNFGDETAPAAGTAPADPKDPNAPAKPAQPAPKKPGPQDVARPAQNTSPGGTPGHAGAASSNNEAVSAGSKKAALSEIDALRRRLKQGRPIDDWSPKAIGQGVLDSMLYALKVGEDPLEVVGKARQSIEETHEQRTRRDETLSDIKGDVASGLGKLANGLRTGRIAVPTFASDGIKVMQSGISKAMRSGAAHAMEDRGHPHSLKSVESHDPHAIVGSYGQVSAKLGKFWDSQAAKKAESQRQFLDRLANYVVGMPAKKDDDDLISELASISSRLDTYGAQAMSSYENSYGVTNVAASQVEAESNGDDGATTDDGEELDPGEQVITWHTTDSECDLCADRDEQQYTLSSLPGWPGDGFFGDMCAGGPNCNCSLTYDDATAVNGLKVNGYASDRAGQAQDQADRMQQLNDVRQIFVDSLPESAGARAAERDAARSDLAEEMGARQGFTAWPADVPASDVRDRLDGKR